MENFLTLECSLTTPFGEHYSISSKTSNAVVDAWDGSELGYVTRTLTAFLRQCGYLANNEIVVVADRIEVPDGE